MPKLPPPPLPPEFRGIRDNPDLTEDEKLTRSGIYWPSAERRLFARPTSTRTSLISASTANARSTGGLPR
jgi:hypothetical protein